ncbi:uncharacterized protein LOC110264953 [Arachis ipaensis]|uniref:uncharacterized protein LOC110264953 n=1 Tax=Arachis ipaensis TaxID=130454 RepID=UPI000A2B68CE|nr:uncharacterized protein LOC110264953 [Arachis ipaensis]
MSFLLPLLGQQCQLHIMRMFKAVTQDLLVLLRPLLNQLDLRDSQSRCRCHSRSPSYKHRHRRSHHRCRHAVIRTMKELDLRGGGAKQMLLMSQLILASLRNQVKEVFNGLFNSYRVALNSDQAHQSAQHSQDVDIDDSALDDVHFAAAFENNVQASESVNTNEVDLYLMESLEKPVDPSSFDILTWWKVSSNNYKYPILSQIARDILTMPVSTVASESAFSTGGRVLNQYRSSLTPKIVEALICAQNWFRANSLPIDLEESFEEFEKLEKELEPIPQLIDEEDSGDESD